ncbi:hypothetical protein TCDM_11457 [Trypanosoma cruzi Dm28c]|uniref:Secreted protein n=1 Tax=Trypanosoma cruzi Dm28c TaxID=1416333 RepID=V5B0B4_TRYCR|nr:hypothetical protein TCDM_11457 [Trypanosoma cruzi Dm28c]
MRCNHTTDQVGRHALHLVVLVIGAHLPSSQSTAWCCKRLTSGATCVENHMCGINGHPHSLIHLRSLHSPAHKGGAMGKRNPPHSARTRAHAIATSSTSHRSKEPCAQHKHGGNERDASNSTARPFTSPFPDGLAFHTHSEARRTPSAPSICTQQAGVQSSSCHRNGEHKQSSSRTIGASSRKE